MLRLNLGAADRHIEGFTSVDLTYGALPPCPIDLGNMPRPEDWAPFEREPFVKADLDAFTWPWRTSSVDEIAAYDIVEHLFDRIHAMNEIHRVLKPGAKAVIETPNASKGAGYFQDPTHKSPWVMNSFQYFRAGSFAQQRLAKSYGITASFKVLQLSEFPCKDEFEEVWKIRAVLEAVKL